MKKVQISEELFIRLCLWFLLDRKDSVQEEIITYELQAKLDSIQRRKEYAEQLKQSKQGHERPYQKHSQGGTSYDNQ